MASLTITKSYLDGTLLTEAQLDSFCDSMETFFNTTKINDDNLAASGITASDKIITGSVDADCIGSLQVTQAKFEDGAVTASKIDALAATNAKFASGAITTAKITDGVITEDLVEASVYDTTDTASGGQAGVSSPVVSMDVSATPTLTGSRAGIFGMMGNTDATDTQNITGTLTLSGGTTGGYLVFSASIVGASSSLTEVADTASVTMITGCSTSYSAEWEIPMACPFLLASTNVAGASTVTLSNNISNSQVGTGGTASVTGREVNGRAFYYEF